MSTPVTSQFISLYKMMGDTLVNMKFMLPKLTTTSTDLKSVNFKLWESSAFLSVLGKFHFFPLKILDTLWTDYFLGSIVLLVIGYDLHICGQENDIQALSTKSKCLLC